MALVSVVEGTLPCDNGKDNKKGLLSSNTEQGTVQQ